MTHEYQVGDRVKLKNRRGANWNPYGEMDKYMGTEVIIDRLVGSDVFQIPEEYWLFGIDDIEEKVSNKHNFQIGDRVRLKNRRGFGWNLEGAMDRYMGTEVIIDRLVGDKDFQIKGEYWWFTIDDIEEKVFKPDDLQTGDIVKYKDGKTALVLDIPHLGVQLQREEQFISLELYDDNMKNSLASGKNIAKVYRPIESRALLADGVDLDDTSSFQLMWTAKGQRYCLIDEFMSTKEKPKYLAWDRDLDEYHLSSERYPRDYYTDFTMEEIKEGGIPLDRFRLVPVTGQ